MEINFNSNLGAKISGSDDTNKQSLNLNNPLTQENYQQAFESIDKFSLISDIVGGGFSAVFTLENDKILNLKSVGQEVRDTVIQNRLKAGTGDLSLTEKLHATKLTMKNVSGAAVDGAKHGAIVDGALSVVINGFKVLTGKEKGDEAVGALAADTVSGALSGAGGAITGGLTALSLGAAGLTGLPGTVLIVGAGLIGAVGINLVTQKTGLYDSIKNNVKAMFSPKI